MSSYIEVIQVSPGTFQKAIRTGEGNVNRSLSQLAFKGKKLSQDEKALEEEILVPTTPTINYKISNNIIPQQQTAFSLKFVENVFVDEIMPQGFGEQPDLDNCGIGINIYYDGEIATDYSELGWSTYAVDWGGGYIQPNKIFGLQPVVYEDVSFGLASTYALGPNGSLTTVYPRISQSYANIPQGSINDPPPTDYELNQRISNHLADKEVIIEAGNNAYFSFDVFNDTAYNATLIIELGNNRTQIDVFPNARNRISTNIVTDSAIDVSITAQTIIEPQTTTLLFGVLVTATNNADTLQDIKLNTDVVLIDTRTKRYFTITIFDNAPTSVTDNFRNAPYYDSRSIAATIYKEDTSEIWWIYKRETNQIKAEVFKYNGSNGATWTQTRNIYSIDQRFEIFDAKLVGDEIIILLNKIYDSSEDFLYSLPDVSVGNLRECVFIIYNTKTQNAKFNNLTTSLGIGGIRRFTPANKTNEYFAINDDTVYRLAVDGFGSWSVLYKTTTRDSSSSRPTSVSKIQFPSQFTTDVAEGQVPYNGARFRDILYDKANRKLYLSLQANYTPSRPGLNGQTNDTIAKNSIFIAKCEADEALTGEQLTWLGSMPPGMPLPPSSTSVADLFKIGNKIYFSNSESNAVYYKGISGYNRQYTGLGDPRILPSGYFATVVTTLEILQDGKFISYEFDSSPHSPFEVPYSKLEQFPEGQYYYENVVSVRRDLAKPEFGFSALTLGPTKEASYSQTDRRVYLSNFSLCYEAIGGLEDSACIGQDIAFNGLFKSGTAGWTTTGYVSLNGPVVEMSGKCQGYDQDAIISQTHYSGGPVTPPTTIIQSEDKVKLIADVENISIYDAEVYATVNNKTRGFKLKSGERRFIVSSDVVGNDGIAASSIRVKTQQVTLPTTTAEFIAPITDDWTVDGENVIGDNWRSYNLFSKEIKVRPLGNADRAWTTGRYTAIGNYVYTINYRNDAARGLIRKTNAAEDRILYNYSFFFGDNRHSFESLSPAGNNLCVIRRFGTDKFLDIIDTVNQSILRTYDISAIASQFSGVGTLLPSYDAKRNLMLLASDFKLFKLDLESGQIDLITAQIPNISSVTVDPVTGLYYVASTALSTDYVIDNEYKLFKGGTSIFGIDQFGGIITKTSIYRGDRPINGVSVPVTLADLVQPTPLLSLTCSTFNNRKFIMWAKNEPIVRNSTGFKEDPSAFNDYGYKDTVGYNNTSIIYAYEFGSNLPEEITNARPAACLHNRHNNRTSPLTFWNEQ